jgi:hypothetical protein
LPASAESTAERLERDTIAKLCSLSNSQEEGQATLAVADAESVEALKNGFITIMQESYSHSQHTKRKKVFDATSCLENDCPSQSSLLAKTMLMTTDTELPT